MTLPQNGEIQVVPGMTSGEAVTTRLGNLVYRAERHFARLPAGRNFGQAIQCVATDSSDRVFVCQRDRATLDLPPVCVFDRSGEYLGGWGTGIFESLHGVFITPNDSVYLVDQDRHQVFVCTTDGEVLLTLGSGVPSMTEPFNFPSAVSVAGDGTIYVADGDGNTRIHKFSAAGEHLLSWGEAGRAPGQLTTPHSLCIDHHGRVYVADRDSGRIVVFTAEGEFSREWSEVLHQPTGMYVDPDGVLYVCDLGCRVHMYDQNGNVLGRGHAAARIHAITGDSAGNLYLAGELDNIERWRRVTASESRDVPTT